MKLRFFFKLNKLLTFCLLGSLAVSFTACVEDDDFNDFRTPSFFIKANSLTVNEGSSLMWRDSSINATSRTWTFTGGEPATSTEPTVEVTYPASGTYLTMVEVTFADGRTESRSIPVEVVEIPRPDFSASALVALPDQAVTFTNLTEGVGPIPDVFNPMDSSILYKWTFPGSNAPDTVYEHNPVVSYSQEGTYDVTLTVVRRATNTVVTEVKEDYITVDNFARISPAGLSFGRAGTSFFIRSFEGRPFQALPADIADNFSVSDADGNTVGITGVSFPDWADGNTIIEVGLDAAAMTVGTDYTLNYTGQAITYTSTEGLSEISESFTYLGEPDWLDFLYPADDPNQPLMATLNGKTFTSDSDGVLYAWGCNPAVNVFNPVDGYRCPGYNAGSPISVVFTPEGDATLNDLRDVGIEISFIVEDGSSYQVSQPVTDLQFHNTFGNNDQIPTATLSTDGMTITINSRGARNGGARITAILEGPVAAEGVTISHNGPEDSNTYISASVK